MKQNKSGMGYEIISFVCYFSNVLNKNQEAKQNKFQRRRYFLCTVAFSRFCFCLFTCTHFQRDIAVWQNHNHGVCIRISVTAKAERCLKEERRGEENLD